MSVPKFIDSDLKLIARSNHIGHLVAISQPMDEDGAILPGLTVQLEIKSPIIVDRCLFLISLFQLHRGVKLRAYQLEVAPNNKRTHNDKDGPVYGPHEHVGDLVAPCRDPSLTCSALTSAFAFFCQRINLSFSGQIVYPESGLGL